MRRKGASRLSGCPASRTEESKSPFRIRERGRLGNKGKQAIFSVLPCFNSPLRSNAPKAYAAAAPRDASRADFSRLLHGVAKTWLLNPSPGAVSCE